jgi:hypothetical protein
MRLLKKVLTWWVLMAGLVLGWNWRHIWTEYRCPIIKDVTGKVAFKACPYLAVYQGGSLNPDIKPGSEVQVIVDAKYLPGVTFAQENVIMAHVPAMWLTSMVSGGGNLLTVNYSRAPEPSVGVFSLRCAADLRTAIEKSKAKSGD